MKSPHSTGAILTALLALIATLQPLSGISSTRPSKGGLIARWDFDEGEGTRLSDAGPFDNHGTVYGAEWIRSGTGYALRFDGVDDYVDCGSDPSLDLRGSLTLEAWVHPDLLSANEPGIAGKSFESYALTYYRGNGWFYISSGGNQTSGALPTREWSHIAGTFDGETIRLYVNGMKVAERASAFPEAATGGVFFIGRRGGTEGAPLANTLFAGALDAISVYDRPLSREEVVARYNRHASEKGREPIDLSLFGRIELKRYLYPDRDRLVVSVDSHWLETSSIRNPVTVTLESMGTGESVASATPSPDSHGYSEVEFSLKDLREGRYRVAANGANEDPAAEAFFELPVPTLEVPPPEITVAPPLPPDPGPTPYEVAVDPEGALTVSVGKVAFPVASSYSYPYGGENALPSGPTAEPEWSVRSERISEKSFKVIAKGKHYRLDRTLELEPTRIEVSDRITNLTDEVLGIELANGIDIRNLRGADYQLPANPSVFVSTGGCGLGLLALDDLYQIRQDRIHQEGLVSLRDSHFGLGANADYTVRWALYPTASEDYFDFINAVRKYEGLNGYVEGGLELTSRWGPPSEKDVRLKGLEYVSICYLTKSLSDPTISLEGWEFMDYPELCDRIKKAIDDTKEMFPHLKPMFHVAHSLYATDKPAELFGDSRALDPNGNQEHYGPNSLDYYGKYFDKELFDSGWRWWTFYPSLENRFGRRMLETADFMIGELGAEAMWADGFVTGYVRGGYTYDRWDGHSVTLDPETKTVVRKKGSVTYLALPVLKEVVRKFESAGGVVITNGEPGPRSLWRENMISSCETGGGDQQPISALHLGRTVTPLGNPGAIDSSYGLYRDVLGKLDHGALYFWYGERDFVTEDNIVAHMYPLTFDSIHGGIVRGRERIVTSRSGVYGWPGDDRLHLVHSFDSRGGRTHDRFYSTADASGVRTELRLGEDESAVLERIPIRLRTSSPMNVTVREYEPDAVRISLNGKGGIELILESGKFAILPNLPYLLQAGESQMRILATGPVLRASLGIEGPIDLQVEPLIR